MIEINKDSIIGQLTVLGEIQMVKGNGKRDIKRIKCLCSCGVEKFMNYYSLRRGKTNSCGCNNKKIMKDKVKDLTNIKFGSLFTIQRKVTSIGKIFITKYLCICDCGKSLYVDHSKLLSGKTRSCGCSRQEYINDLTGNTYGDLQVLSRIIEQSSIGLKKNRTKYICLCKCGMYGKIEQNNLLTGHTTRCGNCCDFKNGHKISNIQIQLGRLIKFCSLNYKIGKHTIDIALAEEKIAIEYDEWYWHGGTEEREIRKNKFLIDNGWKILRIKSSNTLPSIEHITYIIQNIRKSNDNYTEIKLGDWGKGKTFQDHLNNKKKSIETLYKK